MATSNIQPTPGLTIASLVLGIISLLLSIPLAFGAIITGILAIIFGIIGIKKVNTGKFGGKGVAIAGLVLGVMGTTISLVLFISLFSFFFSQYYYGGI